MLFSDTNSGPTYSIFKMMTHMIIVFFQRVNHFNRVLQS